MAFQARTLERCPSGRRGTPGKRVCVNSAPRVRIPLSPPGWRPYWSPRGDILQTPPGPEGSNGSSRLERRGVAGMVATFLL